MPYVRRMSRLATETAYGQRLYDLFNDEKDYAADAEYLRALVMRHRPKAATWLDVACGTGHHLAALTQWFSVAGVDLSASMLASARRHNDPEVPLYQGNFLTFDLEQAFDVVSCLFSSICHAETPADLDRAVARMGAHVSEDGLLLVERYFAPDQFDDSRVGTHHLTRADLSASQFHVSRRDGARAELHVHYVLAEPGRVEHHDVDFVVGLFDDADYARALDAAGFQHRTLLADALTGRGLYVSSRSGLHGDA